jgi:hypothetical protein
MIAADSGEPSNTARLINAAKIAGMMMTQFLLITVNYRMVAQGSYLGTAVSEVGILLLGWTLIRKVSQSDRWQDRVGYVTGGLAGSMLGLLLTGA